MRRYAFLAGGHEEQRREPLGQRDFGTLKHRADRDRELLAALGFVALIEAIAMRFAFKLGDLLAVHVPAMRADRTLRPNSRFQPFAGLGFVLEDRVFQQVGHGLSSY